jgi:hypothetical protein
MCHKTGTGSIASISSKATGSWPGRTAAVRGTASQAVGQADAAGAGQQHGFTIRHMDQLVRAHMLMSQVGWGMRPFVSVLYAFCQAVL